MSFVQKSSKTKKSKQQSSIDFSNDIKKLERKITELQHKKESPKFIQQFSQFERIVENLQNKINRLEQKNKHYSDATRELENSVKEMKKLKPTSSNSNEVRILNNVINEDLNKMKIKIEKNEDILKKILFN